MRRGKTAEQVLKECGINSRPVPLDEIIQHYGIRLIELPGNDDIFGAIISQEGKVVIAVNPNQHLNRRRFTVAHEIGHYFCHLNEQAALEHVDGDFRVHWRNGASSEGVNWPEIEANRFAAALLMPEKLLRPDVERHSTLDRDVVQQLSSLYQVSRLAMHYRLIHLGLLPPDVDPSSGT